MWTQCYWAEDGSQACSNLTATSQNLSWCRNLTFRVRNEQRGWGTNTESERLSLSLNHNRKLTLTGVTREHRCFPTNQRPPSTAHTDGHFLSSPSKPPSNTQLPLPILHSTPLLLLLLSAVVLCPNLLTHTYETNLRQSLSRFPPFSWTGCRMWTWRALWTAHFNFYTKPEHITSKQRVESPVAHLHKLIIKRWNIDDAATELLEGLSSQLKIRFHFEQWHVCYHGNSSFSSHRCRCCPPSDTTTQTLWLQQR